MSTARTTLYKDAGITNPREQIDVAELYVPFCWYEPMWLEGHDIAGPGEGWKMVDSGDTEITGSFPVNPSGGVLSSNPIGASGMIRFVEAALQVRGKAGEHQVEGAEVGARPRLRRDGAILRHGRAVEVAVAVLSDGQEGESTMTMSMQEISDRLEIQDLMVRYSYAIDSRNWDALDDVFTPDAHIDYSVFGGSVGNLAETKAFLTEAMPMFTTLQHMVSGTTIAFDGDTRHHAKTQCHNPMTMGDAENPDLMVCGLWYVDKLVRTPDGWRIKERVEEKVYMKVFPGKS